MLTGGKDLLVSSGSFSPYYTAHGVAELSSALGLYLRLRSACPAVLSLCQGSQWPSSRPPATLPMAHSPPWGSLQRAVLPSLFPPSLSVPDPLCLESLAINPELWPSVFIAECVTQQSSWCLALSLLSDSLTIRGHIAYVVEIYASAKSHTSTCQRFWGLLVTGEGDGVSFLGAKDLLNQSAAGTQSINRKQGFNWHQLLLLFAYAEHS